MPLPGRAPSSPAAAVDARLGALGLRRTQGWVPQAEPSPPVFEPVTPAVPSHDLGAPVPDLSGVGALLRAALVDRLPAGLRGARLELSWAAAGAVTLLCVVAVTLAGLSFLRVRHSGAGIAETPPPQVPTAAAVLPAGPGVVVDVAGRVRKPGLVTLPPGARVADALAAAGGALRAGDVALLNLARKLVDGEQLLVGVQPPPGAGGAAAGSVATSGGAGTAESPLDLNAATLDQLDGLPGVGPVLAQRIVDWRTSHNGFTSVDQLRQVAGIGGRKFDQLRPLVRV